MTEGVREMIAVGLATVVAHATTAVRAERVRRAARAAAVATSADKVAAEAAPDLQHHRLATVRWLRLLLARSGAGKAGSPQSPGA